MQIAGLISAIMAMIVTVSLGFLLEPLPRVRSPYRKVFTEIKMKLKGLFFLISVCPGSLGHCEPEGDADAVQRDPVPVEEGQAGVCRCSQLLGVCVISLTQDVAYQLLVSCAACRWCGS